MGVCKATSVWLLFSANPERRSHLGCPVNERPRSASPLLFTLLQAGQKPPYLHESGLLSTTLCCERDYHHHLRRDHISRKRPESCKPQGPGCVGRLTENPLREKNVHLDRLEGGKFSRDSRHHARLGDCFGTHGAVCGRKLLRRLARPPLGFGLRVLRLFPQLLAPAEGIGMECAPGGRVTESN